VSLYHWSPVWLFWNQLYKCDYWNFLFLFAEQTNPKKVKQEVNGTVILPPLVFSFPWFLEMCQQPSAALVGGGWGSELSGAGLMCCFPPSRHAPTPSSCRFRSVSLLAVFRRWKWKVPHVCQSLTLLHKHRQNQFPLGWSWRRRRLRRRRRRRRKLELEKEQLGSWSQVVNALKPFFCSVGDAKVE